MDRDSRVDMEQTEGHESRDPTGPLTDYTKVVMTPKVVHDDRTKHHHGRNQYQPSEGYDDDGKKQEQAKSSSPSSSSASPSQQHAVAITTLYRYSTPSDVFLIVIGTISAIVSGVAQPLQVIMFGDLVQSFQYSGTDIAPPTEEEIQSMYDSIATSALELTVLGIVVLVFGTIQVFAFNLTATRQCKKLREAYVSAILRQEIGWFDMNDPMTLTTRVSDATLRMQDGMGRKVSEGIQFVSMFVGGVVIAFVKGPELAAVLMAVLPFIGITTYYMMKIMGKTTREADEAYAGAGAIAEEAIGSIRTVQSFNATKLMIKKYTKALVNVENASIKTSIAIGVGTGAAFFSEFVSFTVAMWYGGRLIAEDQLTPPVCTTDCYDAGRVLIVFFAVLTGAVGLGQAGPSVTAMQTARSAAVKVFEVIDRPSCIDPAMTDGKVITNAQGTIEIDNVTFAYPSRPENPVSRNYSLRVNAGETLALVGESGCGKSTIVSLVERYYDPQEGSIKLDGDDLRSLNLRSLRDQIGFVGQEPTLFAMSIAENIRAGKPDATQEEIEEAAKMANAYDFITSFARGFDTEVGERGVQLSGGQKQRIAIARAIIKNPAVLLLDEATSALDTESERVVQKSLDDLMAKQKRTTIVIAHRLSTIRNADRIAVIYDGGVIESGTHEELLKIQGGHYYNMVHARASEDTSSTTKQPLSGTMDQSHMVQQSSSNATAAKMASDLNSKSVVNSAEVVLNANGVDDQNTSDAQDDEPEYKVGQGRIWKLSLPDSGYLLVGSIGAMGSGAVFPVWGIFLVKITALFFEQITADEMRRKSLNWAMGFLGLGAFYFLSVAMQNYCFGVVSNRLTTRLRTMGFAAIMRQDIGWFDLDENASGALVSKLASDTALIKSVTSESMNRSLTVVFSLVTVFVIAFIYSWEMTLITIAVFPILGFGAYIQMASLNDTGKQKNAADAQAGALLTESISAIRTVASLSMELATTRKYVSLLQKSGAKDVKDGVYAGLAYGASQGLMFMVIAFLFWYGGQAVGRGRMGFEDMFMVIMVIMFSSFGLGVAGQNAADGKKVKKATSGLFQIIDRVPSIDIDDMSGEKPSCVEGVIEMSHVNFSYPSRPNQAVYKDYSLKVHKGETMALVGASGGGKSTAISLIERFYDPSAGNISFDGRNLQSLNLEWLRNHVSLVSQEPSLFSGTVAENIAYGKPSATRDEIIHAAKQANAHNFIMNFENGYDTDVGDRGAQVSGGQKQRIAIARAIVRDPEVLLLDEATSALDNESEKIVQASLDTLMRGKARTTIVIAHRLSTIRDADCIAVVDDGRIVEKGTHEELMALPEGGIYRMLVELQESPSKR